MLQAWALSLVVDQIDRRRWARFYLEAMIEHMVNHRGQPPGFERNENWSPTLFSYEFYPHWRMDYTIADIRRWFRKRERVITVVQIRRDGSE